MSGKKNPALTNEQKKILFDKGTEAPFSGKFLHNKETGMYTCANCGAELFHSETKFDSGSGWPSFYDVASTGAVKLQEDNDQGMRRVEVTCANCGGHLGHVFNDLPASRPDMYFVYAILCDNNDVYIGQTNNMQARWKQHLEGAGANHLKKHKPERIIHYEIYNNRESAVRREKWLKTGFGRKWLKREWKAGRTRQAGAPDQPTGTRFCVNSLSLDFVPQSKGGSKSHEPRGK